MNKKIILTTMLACCCLSLQAQETEKKGNAIIQVFSNFHTGFGADRHDRGFELDRLIVTHNMGQAERISARSMFMYLGELVEYDNTRKMFSQPSDERTKAYLKGEMG